MPGAAPRNSDSGKAMEITGIIDLIAKYGTWVVFAALWWLERGERRALQAEVNTLYERVLTSMKEGTDALRELRYVVRGDRRDHD